jgi:hypothetical protein
MNGFSYVEGNPVNWADPSGLCSDVPIVTDDGDVLFDPCEGGPGGSPPSGGGGRGGAGAKVTPTDLHAFGGSPQGPNPGPRPVRPGTDITPNAQGMVGPESPPFPHGASTFGNPIKAPLTGHYWKIPKGTSLPKGFDVMPDGVDVNPTSIFAETHHTIFPCVEMTFDNFNRGFLGLPWEYGGKK